MKASGRRLLYSVLVLASVASFILAAWPAGVSASAPEQAGIQYAAQPVAACTYVVRPGDDLFRIGLRFGVSPFFLAALNGIPNVNLIFAGMLLRVPCAVPPPSSGICSVYFVRPGEWLSLIARRFGVSAASIAAVNHLFNPNFIFAGERLLIPCASSQGGAAAPGYGGGSTPYGQMNPGVNYPPPMPPAANPPPTVAAGMVTVNIQNFAYSPATVTVRAGQSIVWANKDAAPHSATQGTCSASTCAPMSGGFDTGILSSGQSSAPIPFNTPGTYHYYCRVHGAMMQGDVVVTQ